MAITPAALMKEKLMVKSEVKDATMIGSVCDAVVCVNISASRNSFQLARNANRIDGDHRRQRQRQMHLGQRLPARTAVDARGLVEFVGQRLEVVDQNEDRERDRDGEIGDDQRRQAIEQAEIADEQEERHHQRDVRDHARCEDAIDRGLPPAEADLGHGVCRRNADKKIEQRPPSRPR